MGGDVEPGILRLHGESVNDEEKSPDTVALEALLLRYGVEFQDDEEHDMWAMAEAVSDFVVSRRAPEPSREGWL